jgi:hypothetical protein
MIASPGPLHESSLVHGCLSSRRSRSGALGWYVGRPRRIVPPAPMAWRASSIRVWQRGSPAPR